METYIGVGGINSINTNFAAVGLHTNWQDAFSSMCISTGAACSYFTKRATRSVHVRLVHDKVMRQRDRKDGRAHAYAHEQTSPTTSARPSVGTTFSRPSSAGTEPDVCRRTIESTRNSVPRPLPGYCGYFAAGRLKATRAWRHCVTKQHVDLERLVRAESLSRRRVLI